MSVCASVCKCVAWHTATYLDHEREPAADEARAAAGAARGDETRHTLVGSEFFLGKSVWGGRERVRVRAHESNKNKTYSMSAIVLSNFHTFHWTVYGKKEG